ncbi:ATP-dependent DNA helicase RecG [Chroococcidiopsis sp. TS-821]|uniref:ATP-dependent DNA helicase RecG n=1 Tax=Chroococcidiopsis sp. TS-821 TaxID=1378066 RepID=UPI000CEDF17C|nr:ATP-dependent DNA helicase RecG [Chroococcidiopsis sp. TS-821]PPS44753.1 ATP-dependent DNA helicase RecG [Chroococcidiopsis sp. TS-821]
MTESLDLGRLQKALAVEAERGFADLVGKQYRFSEFLCLSFGKPPVTLPLEERRRWQEIAAQFAKYPELPLEERQHLVAEARRCIYHTQRYQRGENVATESTQKERSLYSTKTKLPPTTPVTRSLPTEAAIHIAPSLEQPLKSLPEVGVRRGSYLARLGLYTVRDILFYYPRDHIDYARQVNIKELQAGETVTILGAVKRCTCFNSPRNPKLTILELVLKDSTGQIRISRFFAGARYSHRGWQEQQKRRYPVGAVVAASGLVKESKYGLTLEDPEIEVLAHPGDTIDSLTIGRVVPVYALTEGVGADMVRKAVTAALPACVHLKDPLPFRLRDKYGLMELKAAIANIHFPADSTSLEVARRRLVFDEFFYLQLGLLQRQHKARQIQNGAVLTRTGQLIDSFYQLLPFQLTNAQLRVINDILDDLQKPVPMNRLVQGDVGSGKTVVAVVAILAAIQSGYQAALMAPTEVLAEQHYRKLVSWFNLLHLPVELLTGSTKTAKRRQIHAQLETGELPLLVGTHALIQEKVNFQRLGLVVIDEQHRFGVGQRAQLQQKGESPHVLTMTATPIPRTLALTLHGDLDVSQIDELPPGRQQIQTTVLSAKERTHAYDLINREIAQGRQAYIVLPLVEESEKLDVRAAVEEHQRLQGSIFPQYQVGLLHGRMSSADKDAAINQFRDNQTQILVSTTVIEVGVDVPNATVMMIENAERFGLSQLHQLRGRVGRGAAKSYCILMSNSKAETAISRLKVLEQSQDGFFISEMDMRFRGPGEVLGTRQSGLPDFTLASLVEDQEVLELARAAAEKVIEIDATLERWRLMKAELEYRYQKLMGGAILT